MVGAINELLVQIGGVVTQISGMVSTLNATNLEVTEAMEGFDGLDHRLDLMDSATATVAGEVIAARDGESSLSERLAKMDVDLETALSEDGQPKLYQDLSLHICYSTPLTGVFNTTLSSTTVTGTDTVFLTELSVGQSISFYTTGSLYFSTRVTQILSDTSLVLEKPATATSANSAVVWHAGLDDSDGSAADAGHALASIQGAISKVPKDLNGHLVDIYLAPGFYAEQVMIEGFRGKAGSKLAFYPADDMPGGDNHGVVINYDVALTPAIKIYSNQLDIEFNNITICGYADLNRSDYVYFYDNTFVESVSPAIRVNTESRVTAKNCRFNKASTTSYVNASGIHLAFFSQAILDSVTFGYEHYRYALRADEGCSALLLCNNALSGYSDTIYPYVEGLITTGTLYPVATETIGSLGDLTTIAQNNIVSAINEVVEKVEGGTASFIAQPSEPLLAASGSIWIDTDNYSRYDTLEIIQSSVIVIDAPEVLFVNGSGIVLTLHAATTPGIIKKIYNTGASEVTINNDLSALVYTLAAGSSIELITDGTGWRY